MLIVGAMAAFSFNSVTLNPSSADVDDDELCSLGFECISGDDDGPCPKGFECEQECDDDDGAPDCELKECELNGDDDDDDDDGICARMSDDDDDDDDESSGGGAPGSSGP